MNEKDFRLIVLITAILGCLFLIIFSYFYSFNSLFVSDLFSKKLNNTYSVCGKINTFNCKENTCFFNLCDQLSCIDSVLFNPKNELKNKLNYYSVSKKQICFISKYTKYNSKKELIIYRIS